MNRSNVSNFHEYMDVETAIEQQRRLRKLNVEEFHSKIRAVLPPRIKTEVGFYPHGIGRDFGIMITEEAFAKHAETLISMTDAEGFGRYRYIRTKAGWYQRSGGKHVGIFAKSG